MTHVESLTGQYHFWTQDAWFMNPVIAFERFSSDSTGGAGNHFD